MAGTATTDSSGLTVIRPSFVVKLFYLAAILVLVSLALSVAGRWAGQHLALGGHSTSTVQHEIVIGNNVLSVPANMIRFPGARQDGLASSLQLYVHWPDMEGYSDATRDDFNHVEGSRNILFLTFERQVMSRDMSGRFDPVYRSLIEKPGRRGPGDLTVHDFQPGLGYAEEILLVAGTGDPSPFVARCLSGEAASVSLAPCERDIAFGDGLSMTYRFPAELVPDWATLDAAMARFARSLLQTSEAQNQR